jgi:hypothetical protein
MKNQGALQPVTLEQKVQTCSIPKAQWPVTKQRRMGASVIMSSLVNHFLEEKQIEVERERKQV